MSITYTCYYFKYTKEVKMLFLNFDGLFALWNIMIDPRISSYFLHARRKIFRTKFLSTLIESSWELLGQKFKILADISCNNVVCTKNWKGQWSFFNLSSISSSNLNAKLNPNQESIECALLTISELIERPIDVLLQKIRHPHIRLLAQWNFVLSTYIVMSQGSSPARAWHFEKGQENWSFYGVNIRGSSRLGFNFFRRN